MENKINESAELAKRIRKHALIMANSARTSHIGSCLSMADLLSVLHNQVLHITPDNPDMPDRDRFILSKGHGASIYYALLAECGFFPLEWLEHYCEDGSPLGGHVTASVPGVELSTGSLGHGLAVGCGMALSGLREGSKHRIFVLISDGELDEGSNWEAILFAAQNKLENLVCIVDYNKFQALGPVETVINLEPLCEKFKSFGWAVKEVDGHDLPDISAAFDSTPLEPSKPSIILAHTIKGKGVSFMENKLLWHYKSPDDAELASAIQELEQS